MAAPTYATDLVDIFTDGDDTGWSAIGSGASGLNQETDYFIQGTSCLSKNAFSGSTKGMIYNGTARTIAAGDCMWMWITHQTANSLDSLTNGGLQVLIGSGTGDYYHYYVGGNDTVRYDDRWLCVPVDPRTGTVSNDDQTGTPTATTSYFGGLAAMVGGPSKGSPFAIDAIRFGRAFTCTNGDVTNGYASFGGNGSDAGAAAYNDAVTRTWGQIQESGGTYKTQGLFELGTIGTAVDFRDSDRIVFIANTLKVASTFNGFEINNASSRVDWIGISMTALGTTSRGYFLANADATINIDACSFTDMDTFVFDSNSTLTDSTFKGCNQVTQAGSSITGCVFDSSTAATSLLSDNPSNLDGCTFTSDGSNHAIEIDTTGTFTLTNHTFTGTTYATSDGSTGNEVIYNTSGGLVTLNASGNTGTISVRNEGAATTNIIAGAVSVTLTAQTGDGTKVENAEIFVKISDATGSFPFEESVTIVNSGTTATVTHTTHGLATNDEVYIQGASLAANLGIFTITYSDANTYTYTMGSTPGSSPTGTIISTFVILNGQTDIDGEVTMSRVFSSDENYDGWARKSTSSPLYKTGLVSGTVSSTTGALPVALMILDE